MTDETFPILTEADLWAFAIGKQIFQWAAASQLMRHANPACTTMYVHADPSTFVGNVTEATKDFIDWCGGRNPEAGVRFIAFADALGYTPAAASDELAKSLHIESAA